MNTVTASANTTVALLFLHCGCVPGDWATSVEPVGVSPEGGCADLAGTWQLQQLIDRSACNVPSEEQTFNVQFNQNDCELVMQGSWEYGEVVGNEVHWPQRNRTSQTGHTITVKEHTAVFDGEQYKDQITSTWQRSCTGESVWHVTTDDAGGIKCTENATEFAWSGQEQVDYSTCLLPRTASPIAGRMTIKGCEVAFELFGHSLVSDGQQIIGVIREDQIIWPGATLKTATGTVSYQAFTSDIVDDSLKHAVTWDIDESCPVITQLTGSRTNR